MSSVEVIKYKFYWEKMSKINEKKNNLLVVLIKTFLTFFHFEYAIISPV